MGSSLEAQCRARLGTTIRDKWTLEELLGVGGMAAVYVARHTIGHREAIKILHPEVARSKEIRARFAREAKATNAIEHPGAVAVRDADETEDGCPFLVMELLDGETLGQRAARLGGIPPGELVRYFVELLSVLEVAHERHIVHRDIKLDNLFVTKDGGLKVLDFGIAHMRSGQAMTRVGARLGTTAYMPPEQVRGEQVDGRADLFAVGATLFRLIAKRRLHEASGEAELLTKMATLPAPPLASVAPGTDPRLCAIVDRALRFDRAERFADAREMRAALEALLPVAAGLTLGDPEGAPASNVYSLAVEGTEAAAPRGSGDPTVAPTRAEGQAARRDPPTAVTHAAPPVASPAANHAPEQRTMVLATPVVAPPRAPQPLATPVPGLAPHPSRSPVAAAVVSAQPMTPQGFITPVASPAPAKSSRAVPVVLGLVALLGLGAALLLWQSQAPTPATSAESEPEDEDESSASPVKKKRDKVATTAAPTVEPVRSEKEPPPPVTNPADPGLAQNPAAPGPGEPASAPTSTAPGKPAQLTESFAPAQGGTATAPAAARPAPAPTSTQTARQPSDRPKREQPTREPR